MSIVGVVGKILLNAAGQLLVDAANRAVSKAQERLNPKPPTEVPPPIGHDKYIEGWLDGIDRERSQALGDSMTKRARKHLEREDT
jgi:hypothetical protein